MEQNKDIYLKMILQKNNACSAITVELVLDLHGNFFLLHAMVISYQHISS
jgi:hypothetical protein